MPGVIFRYGVVTFNSEQRDLILDILEQLQKENSWLDKHSICKFKPCMVCNSRLSVKLVVAALVAALLIGAFSNKRAPTRGALQQKSLNLPTLLNHTPSYDLEPKPRPEKKWMG